MEKIKNILLKLEFEGNGVVNMDSNDQKFILSETHLKAYHKNVSFAKKSFSRDSTGKLTYKLKISRDCILHDMYKYDMISTIPNIVHNDYLLYSYIASPMSIMRGYMFANKTETIKRKGAIMLCDAIQTCDASGVYAGTALEVFSRSGEKVSNDGTDDKSDNSFYQKETVGDITYSTKGDIDLMNLQFITCDSIFDRYSFNPDKFDIFKSFLNKSLKSFNSELGYYQLKDSSILIPECGVLLSNENILDIVKLTLKNMLRINIKRKGAYAKLSSIKIKLVEDPTIDTYNNDNNWISLDSDVDVDNLNFDIEYFYEEVNIEKAKLSRLDFEEKIKNARKLDKDTTEAKKAQQKESKLKK